MTATITVTINKATPTDSANYNTLEGSVTLWNYTPPTPDIPVIPVIPGTPPAESVTVPVSSDHATVEVKAEVSEGSATVEVDAAEFEQVAVDGAGSVTLDMSGLKDVTISVVSIPTEHLSPVVKEIIGMEPTVTAVVDVNILVNGRRQSGFTGAWMFRLPFTDVSE